MKKFLAVIALTVLLSNPAKAVSPLTPATYAELVELGSAAAAVYFVGAVSFGVFVVYADAEGISFPLCGVQGLRCYGSYPTDKDGKF